MQDLPVSIGDGWDDADVDWDTVDMWHCDSLLSCQIMPQKASSSQ